MGVYLLFINNHVPLVPFILNTADEVVKRVGNLNVCVAKFCLRKHIICKPKMQAEPAMGLYGLMRNNHRVKPKKK